MIIGYLSLFVFYGLFKIDGKSFLFFINWLYRITYLLLIVSIIQYLLNISILNGYLRGYNGVIRYIPIFLPICFVYFWQVVYKLLNAIKVNTHEYLYSCMLVFVTATTYTRGIYFSTTFVFMIMLIILALEKRVKIYRFATLFSITVLIVGLVISSGFADRIIERFISGIGIIISDSSSKNQYDDTFTGRIKLVQERLALVSEHNPLFGYGFIHEENISDSFRKKLKHGSVIYKPEYIEKYRYGYPYVFALRSADIGWADVIINTGVIGRQTGKYHPAAMMVLHT